uniref:Uncharacterized protein n=1 Tax=Oryza rufipogon TaxID=4529 RepID=A0A0E0QNK3_ORYRU
MAPQQLLMTVMRRIKLRSFGPIVFSEFWFGRLARGKRMSWSWELKMPNYLNSLTLPYQT